MKSVSLQLLAAALVCLAAGCSTAGKATPTVSNPKPSYSKAGASTTTSDSPALPKGEYTLLIESNPPGAMVVVNGIPVGRAPQRVVLPGTSRGFFREQVSVKVRFIASDANQASQTVEELLTPLEKIPAAVRFTTSGATRIPR